MPHPKYSATVSIIKYWLKIIVYTCFISILFTFRSKLSGNLIWWSVRLSNRLWSPMVWVAALCWTKYIWSHNSILSAAEKCTWIDCAIAKTMAVSEIVVRSGSHTHPFEGLDSSSAPALRSSRIPIARCRGSSRGNFGCGDDLRGRKFCCGSLPSRHMFIIKT